MKSQTPWASTSPTWSLGCRRLVKMLDRDQRFIIIIMIIIIIITIVMIFTI
jgi:hypothetical protein